MLHALGWREVGEYKVIESNTENNAKNNTKNNTSNDTTSLLGIGVQEKQLLLLFRPAESLIGTLWRGYKRNEV